MNTAEIKKKIDEEVAKYHELLIETSDFIADHPEVADTEFESSKKHVEVLRSCGFDVEYPFAGLETAFRGIYGENNHKYKIAILTEYDALPELGHACGHCLSGSISLLAGIALRNLQDELDADIHVVGTPGEELAGRKGQMCLQGVFDEYDMAMMVHLYNRNNAVPKFQALLKSHYQFFGKPAHASAAPWDGINALNAGQLFFHGIDMLRQHVPTDSQFHGIFTNGGAAPNIVPEECEVYLCIRAATKSNLEKLEKLVDDCAEGAAIMTGCKWKKLTGDYAMLDLRPNESGNKILDQVFVELGIEENMEPGKIFASSDAGNVSYVCPTFHPCLQIIDDAAIHTREFEANVRSERSHKAIATGAKIIGYQIANIFNDEENIKNMKADFEKSIKNA